VISGGASGVDTISHITALQESGKTIAVFGTGLDVAYPKQNKNLFKEIESKGLIVSEYLNNTSPDFMNFPNRNRIIAGLSDKVLVVEAGKKSGALITANFALEMGIDVYAVPGQINSSESEGTNLLIRDGANVALEIEDIVQNHERIIIEQLDLFPLSYLQKIIINELSGNPLHIDDLAEKIKKSPFELSADLLTLEMEGKIQDIGGKCYIRL
jgi:DNA processing protein